MQPTSSESALAVKDRAGLLVQLLHELSILRKSPQTARGAHLGCARELATPELEIEVDVVASWQRVQYMLARLRMKA